MLFLPPEASGPMRCQGVMVTDQEVEKIITFWQKALPASEAEPAALGGVLAQEEAVADRDGLVKKPSRSCAGEHASASMLQRRLRVGYPARPG